MKNPIPAAEPAEQVPILYNPFGDGKLFLRVPSQGSPFQTTRIATLSSRHDSPVPIDSVEELVQPSRWLTIIPV